MRTVVEIVLIATDNNMSARARLVEVVRSVAIGRSAMMCGTHERLKV
jgi:hypothetical protein